MPSTAKKITLNTFFLYARQILNIFVSLYTVRIVLKILGTEDYGIYNVIAGIVATLGFINNSMSNASQRYFSFEIGKNSDGLSNIFSMTIMSYIGIVAVIVLLSESIGLWYVSEKMIIPEGRGEAVVLSFQCVIATFVFSFMSSPFTALIISNENMFVFSFVSVFESVAKLIMTVVLTKVNFDKLILYSFLMIFPSAISFFIYMLFCFLKYKNVKLIKYWNWNQICDMYIYTFSNLGGSIINIFKIQILNVFINQKFNSKVVAARGIATNISGIIQSFSINFSTAISPFVTKQFAQNRKKELCDFLILSCKISYFINFVIGLPAFLEIDYLLKLWLKIPPEYSVIFSKLIIVDCCIDSLTLPLMVGIQATGKISKYVFSMSAFNLLYLPVCLILFHLGFDATSALIVSPVFTFISIFIRIFYICMNMEYKFIKLILKILIPVVLVSVISFFIMFVFTGIFVQSFFRLCGTTAVSLIVNVVLILLFGLNRNEKLSVFLKIKARLKKN